MEKRVLLAVFLSFLVLFIYQSLVVGPVPPEDRAEPRPAAPRGSQAVEFPEPPPLAPAPSDPEPALPAEPDPEPVVTDTEPRDIVVETDYVRAVFANQGAELTSWRLKRYLDQDGQPVELVPAGLPPDYARPFSLAVADGRVTRRLKKALYRPSADRLDVTDRPASLVFAYEDASGMSVRKEFRFEPQVQPYVITFSATVDSSSGRLNPTVQWGPGLSGVQPGSGIAYRQGPQGIFFGRTYEAGVLQDLDVSRLDASDVADQSVYEGQFGFVGIDNHYFLSAAIPADPAVTVAYEPVSVPASVASGDADRALVSYALTLPNGPSDVRLFFGPKDFDVLAEVDRDLVRAIQFGWLAWLVVPLHRSLKWVHGFVGNYGFAIIILTVLINAVMFPLRHKSVVSMRKMQELQPEMKAIQERYANLKTTDPAKQKMNQEIMNLYRERGVNPASGCLPMLLTMPVLFAFYRLLSVAIEIRGAPFVLWITDLSMHDPLYITPLVMGATMVYQQKMTPSPADPTQQKMMMLMPVVFTFMFLWAPSGLVLYWLTSNLWGIGQQVVTNRIIGPPRVHVVRPPAERRVKKRGGAKTEAAKEGA